MTTPGGEQEQPRGFEPPPIEQQSGQTPFTPPAYPPPPAYAPPPAYPPPPQYPPPAGGYPPPYQPPVYGAPYAPGYGAPQTRTNGMAIGSLVSSGLAIPLDFMCYTGTIAAIVGIVLGIIALNQVKQSGEQGRGFAIAGIAIGAVVLALTVVVAIAIGVNL